MIYETFISPTERPNTALEIKRALLSFDKVHIADPNDRDLFPPQAFMMAMGMPPIMGVNMGPVRPLGKVVGYDDGFDRLMSDLDIARRQGLIDVTSTYDTSTTQQMTIGAVLMGAYPLNPRFMLWAYRSLARDLDSLKLAIEGDDALFQSSDDSIQALEISNCSADGGINNDPALPILVGELSRERLRTAFSNIARARLGGVIKSIGFCASKKMVPFFGDAQSSLLAHRIASRANDVIDRVSAHDPFWANRTAVLKVAHEEYIDETVLNKMSIEDVLKLRTSAWGAQANARDEMFQAIAELSKEVADENSFEAAVRERIVKYRKRAEEIERDRATLKLKIRCDVVKGVGGVVAGESLVGLLAQLQTGIGAATILLAGCIFAAGKIKDYAPVIQDLKSAEAQFRDDAGFGLHNFYKRIEMSSKP